MNDDAVYGPTDARPGQPTCLRSGCRQFNRLELGGRCRGCGRRTAVRPRPALFEGLGYEQVPAQAVSPPPASGPPPGAPPLSGGEILSRAVFGGFWTLMSVGAGVYGLVHLLAGAFGGALVGLGLAVAGGFYAGYIFRGGRFRILFF